MKKLCIFDLDGTLTNTLDNLAYVTNEALGKFGIKPSPTEMFKYFAGDGVKQLIKRAMEYQNADMTNYDACLNTYLELFETQCSYLVKPYDDIVPLLDELKKMGIKLSVYSNKPHEMAVSVVEEIFGKGTFDVIIGQREGHEVKPSAEGVFETMETLGVTAKDVLYIGDTNTDVKTGKNAGVFTVGVTWGFRKREELEKEGADVIIDNPLQVLNYLD